MRMCEVACDIPSHIKFAHWIQTNHSMTMSASGPVQVIECKSVVPFSLWKETPSGTSPRVGHVPQPSSQDSDRGSESKTRLQELAALQ